MVVMKTNQILGLYGEIHRYTVEVWHKPENIIITKSSDPHLKKVIQ